MDKYNYYFELANYGTRHHQDKPRPNDTTFIYFHRCDHNVHLGTCVMSLEVELTLRIVHIAQ